MCIGEKQEKRKEKKKLDKEKFLYIIYLFIIILCEANVKSFIDMQLSLELYIRSGVVAANILILLNNIR